MGAQIRQLQLIDILRHDPAVLVSGLARKFNVSESTIRRDLIDLEKIGIVRRVHGGAILEDHLAQEPPFEIREITQREEKALVGKAAASIVKDGMTIFIDGGTTTPFIVPYLKGREKLTVVTVGLNVVYELVSFPSITTIQLGGELHIETQTFAGPLSIQTLETCGLSFDLAFISAVGVSAEYGATNQILDRVPQKQEAIKLSRKVAIVVDGSKLGQVALAHIVSMHDVDVLITDPSSPIEELNVIRALGPEIILAE
jgi:DeoR/GlpR family transcriptional regulator of sugar metabolism